MSDTEQTAASARPPSATKMLLLTGCALLGLLSLWETRVSIFAVLILVIALASSSRSADTRSRRLTPLLWVGLCGAILGIGRFVWQEALPGIAEARGRASSKKAVSVLREILFAQDAMRRYAFIDPDGDSVGSAGTLGELSGAVVSRLTQKMVASPLAPRFSPRVLTSSGPASAHDGYLFMVCLPGVDGTWHARVSQEIQPEDSERRWLAYAWPESPGPAHSAAYFIDEHERILESQNNHRGELRLDGPHKAPACDDALAPATAPHWQTWRGKQARQELPHAAVGL